MRWSEYPAVEKSIVFIVACQFANGMTHDFTCEDEAYARLVHDFFLTAQFNGVLERIELYRHETVETRFHAEFGKSESGSK